MALSGDPVLPRYQKRLDWNILELGRRLFGNFSEVLGVSTVKKIVSEDIATGRATVVLVNSSSILETFANDVQQLLVTNEAALNNITTAIVEKEATFDYNTPVDDVYNRTKFPTELNWFDYQENFSVIRTYSQNMAINLNLSIIYVPTFIYEQDPEMLKAILWTNTTDEVFKYNYVLYPHLPYQYFEHKMGIMRCYPGINTMTSKDLLHFPVTEDFRLSQWYQKAAASCKDMVIIMDWTGSMSGANLITSMVMATQLLDTLQEGDFVGIIYYPHDTGENNVGILQLENRRMLPANARTRQMLLKMLMDLRNLPPSGYSTVDSALETAFALLNETNPLSHGCSQVISVISDSMDGTTVAEPVLNKYNADKQVWIFTYIVGMRFSAATQALEWLACSNKGASYHVKTSGQAVLYATSYIDVLNIPLALTIESDISYSSVYLDYSGFYYLITMSIPVFSNNSIHSVDESFLGVTAVDFSQIYIDSLVPWQLIPFGGYGFLISPEGTVVVHPLLRSQYFLIKKVMDPSLFLNEVEFGQFSDLDKLFNATIHTAAGLVISTDFQSSFIYDKHSVFTRNTKYIFMRLPHIPYTAGIALSSNVLGRVVSIMSRTIVKNLSIERYNSWSDNPFYAGVPRTWPVCAKLRIVNYDEIPFNPRRYGSLNRTLLYVKDHGTSGCNLNLLRDTMYTFGIVERLHKETWSKPSNIRFDQLWACFQGGVFASYPKTMILPEDIINSPAVVVTADHNMNDPDRVLFHYNCSSVNISKCKITAAMGVVFLSDNPSTISLVTVLGLTMNMTYFSQYLRTELTSVLEVLPAQMDWIVLDENAVILMSSSSNMYIGSHLAEVEAYLMQALLDLHFYKEFRYKNPVYPCTPVNTTSGDRKQSGAFLMSTILPLYLSLAMRLQNSEGVSSSRGLTLAVLSLSIYGSDSIIPDVCTFELVAYTAVWLTKPVLDRVSVKGCQMLMYASWIPQTNLMFLAYNKSESQSCKRNFILPMVRDISDEYFMPNVTYFRRKLPKSSVRVPMSSKQCSASWRSAASFVWCLALFLVVPWM